MRFLFRFGIVVALEIASFGVYSPLDIVYLFGGVIYLAASSYFPASNEGKEKNDHPLLPSTHVTTDVSIAWLGAKMDEEVWRKQAEKEPRDQGH